MMNFDTDQIFYLDRHHMYTKSIQIFGDESHFKGVITYALVMVPLVKLQAVEAAVIDVKRKYGVAENAVIHCSELFNDEKKGRSEFKELTFDETMSMLSDVTLNAYFAGARCWIGYLGAGGAPDVLVMEARDGSGIEEISITGIKTKTIMVFQSALGPLFHRINLEHIEVWVDHESTEIEHMWNKKMRVDKLMRFFPIGGLEEFYPTPISKDKPVFLEIADILAYASSHALSDSSSAKKAHFIEVVHCMQPAYSEVVFQDLAGPIHSVRVPDEFADKVVGYLKNFI